MLHGLQLLKQSSLGLTRLLLLSPLLLFLRVVCELTCDCAAGGQTDHGPSTTQDNVCSSEVSVYPAPCVAHHTIPSWVAKSWRALLRRYTFTPSGCSRTGGLALSAPCRRRWGTAKRPFCSIPDGAQAADGESCRHGLSPYRVLPVRDLWFVS